MQRNNARRERDPQCPKISSPTPTTPTSLSRLLMLERKKERQDRIESGYYLPFSSSLAVNTAATSAAHPPNRITHPTESS